jgi:CrcB protein
MVQIGIYKKLLFLALAGGAGTLSRYGLSGLIQRHLGSSFPWGTLFVNMLGCFLFGLLWDFLQRHIEISSEIRIIVLVGFLGSFTTFSSFIFETGQFLEHTQILTAVLNVAGETILGLAAFFLGSLVGTRL